MLETRLLLFVSSGIQTCTGAR